MISYFVLCILAAIGSGVLFLVSAIHVGNGWDYITGGYYGPDAARIITVAMNIFLVLTSLGFGKIFIPYVFGVFRGGGVL